MSRRLDCQKILTNYLNGIVTQAKRLLSLYQIYLLKFTEESNASLFWQHTKQNNYQGNITAVKYF